jgi:feruloyl esterase
MLARVLLLWTALPLLTLTLQAQSPAPGFLDPPPGEATMRPRIGCADLRSLTGYDFSIESATIVPAAGDAPEHCVIRGLVQPEIRFEVTLPTIWNRRFYMTGNGGYAGESLDAPPRANARSQAARRGFVLAMSNTGHDSGLEPLGTFAMNRQKLLDYAFRSLKVTADAGKQIAASYYGARPAKSYYEGCSTGGRQGLILAQRFPEEFDGIVAGSPVLNFTGTMFGTIQRYQAFAKAPVPYAKIALLSAQIYGMCDDKDGLKDGLIDDPRRCDFQPARDLSKCADGVASADCFTSGEIASLEAVYGDVKVQGQKVFPGWPVGAEVSGPNGRSGWDNWIVNEKGLPTIAFTFAETFFRYLAFPEKNPTLDLLSLDSEKTIARLEWIHQVLDATDTDLSTFQKRGGKLFMYFGWADQALNPRMGVEYYEGVLARMGAGVPGFFRLFMVPGMFHCQGGVGCGTFDKLTPTIEWVEKGTPPDRVAASQVVGGKPIRTRPLCPYPQVAVYSGQGSTDDSVNFACRAR